jgi:hypothetical protein
MADERTSQDRPVHRCCEVQCLEEQLWSLAYECVFPVVRKRSRASGPTTKQRRDEPARTARQTSRRA